MAVWPFSRNSGRKRPRSGATLSDHEAPGVIVETDHLSDPAIDWVPMSLPPGDASSRPSQKKRRTMTSHTQNSKLLRRAPTKSAPSTRNNLFHLPLEPPEYRGPRGSGVGNPQTGDDAMEIDDDDLQQMPTFFGRRNPRTQRRKNNRQAGLKVDQETQIKDPLRRPTSDHRQFGWPTKCSKRSRSGFSFGNSCDHSDISLPTPNSIHSSLSSESEAGFKLSTLDSLAPRPTLRYASPVHYCAPRRRPSQRKDFDVTEEILKAHKRIDNLADGFDARDLRELMDRDKRRREGKFQRDREKMESQLARRAALLREEEIRAQKTGAPPPINLHRGVMGRELGDSTPQTPLVSEKEKIRRSIKEQLPQHPAKLPAHSDTPGSVEHIESERVGQAHESDIEFSTPTRGMVTEGRSIDIASPAKQQQKQIPTPPLSPNFQDALKRKSVSRSSFVSETGKFTVVKLPRPQEQTTTPEELKRRKIRTMSLSTFFKWVGKTRVTTPTSSFSNASREEMLVATAQLPAPPSQSQETVVPVRRVASNVPKRTRSRFREDLPELPISPPSSQSPSGEVNAGIHYADEITPLAETLTHNCLFVQPTLWASTPSSEHHALETMRSTPTSWGPWTRSPVPMSLGSIDSEGSWLAGKVVTNRKSPVSRAESRTVSHTTRHQSFYSYTSLSDSSDDLIPEDRYMAQVSPVPNHTITNGGSIGEARPSSDEDEDEDARTEVEDAKWGSVDARQARVVSAHELKAIRSHEGLFNSFTRSGQQVELANTDSDSDAHISIISSDSNRIQRARSIQFGKGHVKHISIGSA